MLYEFQARQTNRIFIVLLIALIVYDLPSCSCQSIGFVEIYNGGAYMLRFSLTYAVSGVDVTRTTGSYPYNTAKAIVTPYGATNLRLRVEYLIFLGVWQEIYANTLQSTNKCFAFYGTVFNAYYSPASC